jgi:hypothetical protein
MLTCQTHDSGHETRITNRKQIETNYRSQFSIKLMLKDEIEKKTKKKYKNNLDQPQ